MVPGFFRTVFLLFCQVLAAGCDPTASCVTAGESHRVGQGLLTLSTEFWVRRPRTTHLMLRGPTLPQGGLTHVEGNMGLPLFSVDEAVAAGFNLCWENL